MFAAPIYRVRNSGQLVQGSRFAWVLFAAIGLSQLIPSGLFASRVQDQQSDSCVHAAIDHLASNGIKPLQSDVVIHDLLGNDGRLQLDSTLLQHVWRGPEIKGARWISRGVGAPLKAPCDLVGLAVRLQI